MRIALIQQHATREKRVNVERGLDALRRAANDGAQGACFAELGVEWFHPQQPAPLNVADLAETVRGLLAFSSNRARISLQQERAEVNAALLSIAAFFGTHARRIVRACSTVTTPVN